MEEAVRERMDRMQSDCVDLLQVRHLILPWEASGQIPLFLGMHIIDAGSDSCPYSSTGMTIPNPLTSLRFNNFKTCRRKVRSRR